MQIHRALTMLVTTLAAMTAVVTIAQPKRAPVTSPRIYVFDAGNIKGLDPKLFNFTREELKEVDFVNIAYLIAHPKGTLMFDAGAVTDSHFKGDGTPVTEGVVSASRPLKPQLAAAGYAPAEVTYLAMSHYHSDHTANANDFAGATWIVQKAERDAMFADKPQGIIQPAHYSALRNAKTRVLDNQDLDVFGDGTVVVMSTPGHTPGHQVLFVRLAKRGPVLLAGDLYHYPEERTTGRIPTFEFNAEQSRASRQKVEAFVKQMKAELWIEHDIATHAKLPRAPGFVE
ncbi:MAG TPA: N-acyl homoserine lactonase family protein [Vicinamibacterales bacterium]|nr:N-acyl homoserine lactonase family protein [Vicinamibacterales bacterium]